MGLSGIGMLSASAVVQGESRGASQAQSGDDAFYEELKSYFFESPGERMFDNWLAAHKISKAEYDVMTPEEKAALKEEFAEEIRRKAEEKIAARVAA
ncbi:MAG: hypothetical protein PHE27_07465 [Alphaproteobacteria bacterium]|nr:hypothetical protein [Alphaproteobacteria bacterium]